MKSDAELIQQIHMEHNQLTIERDTLLGLVRDMSSDLLALGYSEDCQILTRARDILKPEEPDEQTVP